MSVGLEDVLDFQLFLHKAAKLPVDGRKKSLFVEPNSTLNCFLTELKTLKHVCVDAGRYKAPNLTDVQIHGDRVFVTSLDSTHCAEMTLTLVADSLEVRIKPDPRRSYLRLVSVPSYFGRQYVPGDNEDVQECSEILFYPSHSLVPMRKRPARVNSRSTFELEPYREPPNMQGNIVSAVAIRVQQLFSMLRRRYPLISIEKSAFRIGRGYENRNDFVADFYILDPSRPKEDKREKVIIDWMNENMPFPVFLGKKVLVGDAPATTHAYYSISFELPKNNFILHR